MKKTRILYFLTSAVRGGVEEHVLSLLRRVDRTRFEPVLVCPQALLDAFAPDLASLPVMTIPLQVDTPWKPTHVWNLVRFYRALRRLRPHVVNVHLLRATFIGAPLAKLAGVPRVIATNHGPEPWRRGPIKGWYAIDRWVHRSVDLTIAVCSSAKEHLVRTKRLDPASIVVVNNGREMDQYTPLAQADRDAIRGELGLMPDDAAIVVVGRLDIQKGHRFLLDAMPEVLRQHPEARLILVGDGNLRERLETQVDVLEIRERVHFTGFRTDVRRLLGAADLVALPSLWEGLPLTVIEALAMQQPVIASAVNGVLDVITDEETGVLVPPGDSAALAKALVGLLDDPARAARLARQGRARVLERFAIDRQIAETVRWYAP